MKIYTKTGDRGDTGLFGGPRLRKDAPRIEAYGAVDELNALLGVVRAESLDGSVDALVVCIQNELFAVGAELASPDPQSMQTAWVSIAHTARLESEIDRYEAQLPALKEFILPDGCRAATLLHLARTVCRRAERRVVSLAATETISPHIIVYLNRLSDLLFVLARWTNQTAGAIETPWRRPSP